MSGSGSRTELTGLAGTTRSGLNLHQLHRRRQRTARTAHNRAHLVKTARHIANLQHIQARLTSAFERNVAARAVAFGIDRDGEFPVLVARLDGGADGQERGFHGHCRRDTDGHPLAAGDLRTDGEHAQQRNEEKPLHNAFTVLSEGRSSLHPISDARLRDRSIECYEFVVNTSPLARKSASMTNSGLETRNQVGSERACEVAAVGR